jgi:hypothetical protein
MLCQLIDALQGSCPPFCYFGSNGGDSSSLGVWPSEEEIQEASFNEDRQGVLGRKVGDCFEAMMTSKWSIVTDADGAYRELYEHKGGIKRLVWQVRP